ncbi:Zinc finger and BTB domain-containing protein 7B [Branchiostoma belcheri]|nr:Zinc finger and BTB domain-containing protein 7B [Branchiostoma belcheri]
MATASHIIDIPFQEQERRLLTQLKTMRDQDQLCDMTIRVGTREFRCHQAVLAASSAHFRSVFIQGVLSFPKILDLTFTSADVFSIILDFVYTASLKCPANVLPQVLQAAKVLEIHTLVDHLLLFSAAFENENNASNEEMAQSSLTNSAELLAESGRNLPELSAQTSGANLPVPAGQPTCTNLPVPAGQPTCTNLPVHMEQRTCKDFNVHVPSSGQPTCTISPEVSAQPCTNLPVPAGQPTCTNLPVPAGQPTCTNLPVPAGQSTCTNLPVPAGQPTCTNLPVPSSAQPTCTISPEHSAQPCTTVPVLTGQPTCTNLPVPAGQPTCTNLPLPVPSGVHTPVSTPDSGVQDHVMVKQEEQEYDQEEVGQWSEDCHQEEESMVRQITELRAEVIYLRQQLRTAIGDQQQLRTAIGDPQQGTTAVGDPQQIIRTRHGPGPGKTELLLGTGVYISQSDLHLLTIITIITVICGSRHGPGPGKTELLLGTGVYISQSDLHLLTIITRHGPGPGKTELLLGTGVYISQSDLHLLTIITIITVICGSRHGPGPGKTELLLGTGVYISQSDLHLLTIITRHGPGPGKTELLPGTGVYISQSDLHLLTVTAGYSGRQLCHNLFDHFYRNVDLSRYTAFPHRNGTVGKIALDQNVLEAIQGFVLKMTTEEMWNADVTKGQIHRIFGNKCTAALRGTKRRLPFNSLFEQKKIAERHPSCKMSHRALFVLVLLTAVVAISARPPLVVCDTRGPPTHPYTYRTDCSDDGPYYVGDTCHYQCMYDDHTFQCTCDEHDGWICTPEYGCPSDIMQETPPTWLVSGK